MADTTEKKGMKFVVVFAPDEIQVSADLRTSLVEEYGIDPDEYNFEKPQAVLVEKLRTAGIPVLDLLAAFKAHTQHTSLYLRQNTHWNDHGNRLAADEIWSYLTSTGLGEIQQTGGRDRGEGIREEAEA